MKTKTIIAVCLLTIFTACTENYSNGERIGYITQFTHAGLVWKSWEGHLNSTQTGNNSSTPFDFSIDNDAEDANLIKSIDSAAQFGWKVKLVYHKTFGLNWLGNRGHTNFFVTKLEALDKSK